MNYTSLILGAAAIFAVATVTYFVINHTTPTADIPAANDTMEVSDITTPETVAPSEAAPEATSNTSETPVTPGYTMAEVAQHAGEASCWTVINSQVYDLTDFIRKHPGGARNILNLCGKDGTAAFTGQHGGQNRPEMTLDAYFIGELR